MDEDYGHRGKWLVVGIDGPKAQTRASPYDLKRLRIAKGKDWLDAGKGRSKRCFIE